MHKTILHLLLFLGWSAFGQNDSISENINKAAHDSIRCRILSNYIDELFDYDEILKYNKQLEKIVEKNLNRENISADEKKTFLLYKVSVFGNYGYHYQNAKFPKIQLALDYYRKSIQVAEQVGDQEGVARAYANMAFAYEDIGNIKKAADYYHEALKRYRKLKKEEVIASVLNNIGFMFQSQNDYETALKYFTESLKLQQKLKKEEDYKIAFAYNNIGLVYNNTNKLSESLEYFQKAYSILKKVKHKYGQGLLLNNIGDNYLRRSDTNSKNTAQMEKSLATALEHFEASLAVWNELEDWESKSITLRNIGTVYLRLNQADKAIKYGEQSLELARKTAFPKPIMSGANLLYSAYKKKGDYRKSLEMYELFKKMDDSIANQNNRKKIIEKGFAYEYDKKEAIFKEHAKAEKDRDRVIFTSIITVLILLLGFSLIWVYFYRKKKRAEQLLMERELSLEIAEAERRRISADLHDDLGAGIAGIALLSNKIIKEPNLETVKIDTKKIAENTKRVSEKLTEVIWELNSEHDNLEHLLLFIQKQGSLLFKEANIDFSMIIPLDIPPISLNSYQRKQIYLITKECFHNIKKHADASSVRCKVDLQDDLVLEINDNGKGFDVEEKLNNANGEGLKNIKYRLENLKGKVQMTSSNQGTKIILTIPFPVKPSIK